MTSIAKNLQQGIHINKSNHTTSNITNNNGATSINIKSLELSIAKQIELTLFTKLSIKSILDKQTL